MSDTSAPREPSGIDVVAPLEPSEPGPVAPATALDAEPTELPTVRPRLNALAVASLILGAMLSPLAALFGHLAVGQIRRSAGRERGLVVAWVAVGLGYLWLATIVIAAIGAVVVLGA